MTCTDADYRYLRELVLEQSANLIDPSRNLLFDTRLTPLARTAGATNLSGLVDLLRVDRTEHLHRAVAEAMTINETSFFRDVRPFDILRTTIIPAVVAQRAEERTLRIWSAASSTGQEAYSIAMMLLEHFPELARWDVKIMGSDISHSVTEYARRGRYRRIEVNRGLPARFLIKYFERDRDEWEIVPRVKQLCHFSDINLCAPFPALPQFDVVMLRNVLLYFPQQDRSGVLAEVYRQMQPQGYLLLGNAEQAEDSTDQFLAEFGPDCFYYRPVRRNRE